MSNTEQNGRGLSVEQAAPPTDPRTRPTRAAPPTPDSQRICRDFVWGICSMNELCKYRHELDYDSMRSILKFCHDFQNRTGCTRPECTYLHASREEESLFLTSRVIPRVLVDRYTSMSAPAEPVLEPPPPQMIYTNEYITQPPPPPPPPPSTQSLQPAPAPVPAPAPAPVPAPIPGPSMTPQSFVPPNMSGGMIHTPIITPMPISNMMPAPLPNVRQMEQPVHSQMALTVKTNLHAVAPTMPAPVATPMHPLLALPPPPPPPPPPTLTTAPTQMAAPAYTVAQPLQHTIPPMYPTAQLQQPQPTALQSTSRFNPELPIMFDPSRPPPPLPPKRPAPSEAEAGPSKVLKLDDSDSLCDSCVEQNLRSVLDQQEIEKLQREEEYRRRMYEQKTEEYENSNMLLRTLLSPSMFRVVDEFLDLNTPSSDMFASSSSPSYNSSAAAAVPKQFLFQLMEFLLNKRNTEQLTSPLELLTRRTTSQTELMFASILELLQNGVAPESRMSSLDAISGNGLARLTSSSLELAPRYPPATPRYSAAVPYHPGPAANEVVPPTVPYQPEPVPPAPVQYVPYQAAPAPAPAARPFYQPYPNNSNMSNMSPVSYPPSAPAPVPPPAQPYQYLARMPQHYYPPFQ